jgi:hypothetical protein
MKIGDRVVLGEKVEMSYITYYPGHVFTIIGDSGFRGWDLEDDNGNMLYETRFVKFDNITEVRDKKIDDILK